MAYISFQPSDFFNTVIWNGDSTSPINITGVGFQPDFIWGKLRNIGYSHQLYDSVRGFGNDKELNSNEDVAEGAGTADQYGYLSGVVADGFTATAGSDGGADKYGYWNESGKTYASWNWKMGTTSGLTGGTITPSSYSISATAGQSVIAYTGNDTAGATIPHGLGVTPGLIICKRLDGADNWWVHIESFTGPQYIALNYGNAVSTATTVWNDTLPTDTVFSIGTDSGINASGGTFIAYCFAPVTGYSSFGSYTGNGNADGPFVYTGFRPAYLLLKADATAAWRISDNKRLGYNVDNNDLEANSTAVEGTDDNFDIVSNGFKIRRDVAGLNTAGGKNLYMAFAEFPLVSSNDVPTVAR